jgi:uncharacterized membrane protein YgcG
MRKLKRPGRWTAVLLLFTFSAIIFYACKKTDSTTEPKDNSLVESRFFNEHVSSAPQVAAIAGFLKRQNEKDPFIEKLVNSAGYPVWDKTHLAKQEKKKDELRGGGETGNTTFFIPFTKDGQQVVSAALQVTVTPQKDTLVKVLLASKYLDTASTKMKPRHLSLLLMKLDNAVYGRNLYKITDPKAFEGFDRPVAYVRVSDNPSINTGSKSVLVEWTLTICYTVTYPGFCDGQVHGVAPGQNPYCTEYNCESISWWEWMDDGGGGGGGGDGGGTGGGGGGGGGGSNPCRVRPGDENPCGGGQGSGGWEPEPIDDDELFPPCDATDQFSGAQATLQFTENLKHTIAQFTPFDNTITNQPEEYFLVNNLNGAYQNGPILPMPTTGGSMTGVTSNTHMVVHTHPNGGFPFPTPSDFFYLANFTSNFMQHYVIAYDGTKYAMVINNWSQLTQFVNDHPNSIAPNAGFVATSTIGVLASQMRTRLETQGYSADEAYERTLAYIMKQAGVTLTKAAAGSQTFKKIGIRQKMENGSPVVDGSGNPVYENADCN